MTASITLYCNGCADACDATFVAAGGNTADARIAARAGGWRHNPPRGKDYCPRCVRERRVKMLGSRSCRLCGPEHPDLEFRTMLGHDRIGHRAANALARFGVRTIAELQVSAGLLRSVPGMGEQSRARALGVLEMNRNRE